MAAATSLATSAKVLVASGTAPSSGQESNSNPPKPYDLVQGMEHVIDMMEETLQICERAQHSTQDASHRRTFPFGLRPSSDVHQRQAARSIQIQSGRQEPTSDLKVEPRTRRDPLDVPTTRAHDTHSAAAGCGRRSIRSPTSRALLSVRKVVPTLTSNER
jgi:hypothetical protein